MAIAFDSWFPALSEAFSPLKPKAGLNGPRSVNLIADWNWRPVR